MPLGKIWAGQVFGTNTGNLFVKLEGEDKALSGDLRFNDTVVGFSTFAIAGSFDGTKLKLEGTPTTTIQGVAFGKLMISATLGQTGSLQGEWETDIGAAGTFYLHPHDDLTNNDLADQTHTSIHKFGAIEIERKQVIDLAEHIQKQMPNGRVIVTVGTATEQSFQLRAFKDISFNDKRARAIKIFVQVPDDGIQKSITVDFGPNYNNVMVQGSNEGWVLGELEKLKRAIRPFEQTYATNFKKWGFGINQLMLAGLIVFLPSLANLVDRTILMVSALVLILALNKFHQKYLPLAAIHLDKKPKGLFTWFAPSILSWMASIVASVITVLLAAYLKGWLFQVPIN